MHFDPKRFIERNDKPWQSSNYNSDREITMKAFFAALTVFLLVLAFGPGCGGGGGTGGGNGGGTGGDPIAFYAVEATMGGVLIDPTNIQVGETVQFDVAAYTTGHYDFNTDVYYPPQRIVQTATGWLLTDQSLGNLSAGGQFTATTVGGPATVSATVDGTIYSGTVVVKTGGLALVTGRVVDGYGRQLYQVEVDFYQGVTLVGKTLTQGDNTFRAIVPAGATNFEVKKTTIPTGYYKQYFWGGKWFLPSGFCMAALPPLTNGQTTSLGDILIPPSKAPNGADLAPPPPPDPCS